MTYCPGLMCRLVGPPVHVVKNGRKLVAVFDTDVMTNAVHRIERRVSPRVMVHVEPPFGREP